MIKHLRKGSKNSMILEHFEKGLTLTAVETFELFGEMNLSNRVYELKKMGNDIVSHEIQIKKAGNLPRRYYINEYLTIEERSKYDIKYPDSEGD